MRLQERNRAVRLDVCVCVCVRVCVCVCGGVRVVWCMRTEHMQPQEHARGCVKLHNQSAIGWSRHCDIGGIPKPLHLHGAIVAQDHHRESV